jgi:transposase
MLIRFDKTTGVCPVCRTYVKLNMFEFPCSCYNFDRDVASAIVILKEGLSLWNLG